MRFVKHLTFFPMETLSHNQFLDKYLRTANDHDWWYWAQCVDLAKLYSKEVYWETLGSFGGSARTGWYNTKKTFDPKKWEKIIYKPWMLPKKGDIIFYDTWVAWHVAIVHEATQLDIMVLEQNWATWTGDWKGYNQINLETKRDYNNVFGWYRLWKPLN